MSAKPPRTLPTTCPHCRGTFNVRLVRRPAAQVPNPTKPEQTGASRTAGRTVTDHTPAGPDGPDAARLLARVRSEGAALIARLAVAAAGRLRHAAGPQRRLLSDGERAELADHLAAAMAAAELLGRSRVREKMEVFRSMDRSKPELNRTKPDHGAFADAPRAVRAFASADAPLEPLPPLTALARFREHFPALGVRDAARWAAGVARRAARWARQAERIILRRVRGAVRKLHAAGGDLSEASVLDAAGVGAGNASYAELFSNATVLSNWNDGADRERRIPSVSRVFPGWEYNAVVDGHSRTHHAERNGRVYPASQSFADVRGRDAKNLIHCRCSFTLLTAEQISERRRDGPATFADAAAFCGGPGSGRPGPCPDPSAPGSRHRLRAAARRVRALPGAVQARVNAVVGRVPESVRAPLANAYHAVHAGMMSVNHSAQALALEVAGRGGAGPEQVARLGRVLAAADLAVPSALGLGLAAAGNPLAGKLAAYVPVASMAYVVGSAARNPMRVLAAAGKLLREKFPARVRGAYRYAVGAVSHPLTRQAVAAHAAAFADAAGRSLAADVHAAMPADHAAGEWWAALFAAALDDTADVRTALRLAAVASSAGGRPDGHLGAGVAAFAGGYDPAKHPHAPAGTPEGGQFTPAGGGGAAKGGDRPDAGKAKFVGEKVGKAEHVHAAAVEAEVARGLRGRALPDNEPLDVRAKAAGGGEHAVEVKSLLKGSKQAISVHDDALVRKVDYAAANPDSVYHTVAVDERATYEGGAHAENYSGNRLYYRRGAGRWSLASMHKVKDMGELRRLMNTPDADLPAMARGSLPAGEAIAKLRESATKAHESRLNKDRARKQRIRAEKSQNA